MIFLTIRDKIKFCFKKIGEDTYTVYFSHISIFIRDDIVIV
ncbi:hypothetical protein SXCC_00323 [Gluconacetobacter sp. SXCC-1]|nr:hypothetical protein SXCC_00323 [Gluconacetobacter sp. SXCC-1]